MREKVDMSDIVGKHYGKMKVEYPLGRIQRVKGNKIDIWYMCSCSCGNQWKVRRDHIISGHVNSCGRCLNIELTDDGDYRYYDKKGNSFLFSPEDYELVTAHRWRVFKNWYGSKYVMRIDSRGHFRILSREILGVSDADLFVDHINGDTLNYTRANLRVATPSNNSWNARLNAKNTSGYKGVSWNKKQKSYSAYITVHRKLKYLGCFKNSEDAARAYDTAARYYFGEFACVNFPQPGEQGCRRNKTA